MADFDRAYIVTGNTIAERVPKSAGNVGENIVTSLSFTFSDEWEGASKTIVFKSPKKVLLTPIALVDDSVPVPVEALDSAGKLQFSLQGTFADSAKVIRTPIKELDVNGTLPYTGGTPIATYTNVVSECQDATVLAETATLAANQAAALADEKATQAEGAAATTLQTNEKAQAEEATRQANEALRVDLYNQIIAPLYGVDVTNVAVDVSTYTYALVSVILGWGTGHFESSVDGVTFATISAKNTDTGTTFSRIDKIGLYYVDLRATNRLKYVTDYTLGGTGVHTATADLFSQYSAFSVPEISRPSSYYAPSPLVGSLVPTPSGRYVLDVDNKTGALYATAGPYISKSINYGASFANILTAPLPWGTASLNSGTIKKLDSGRLLVIIYNNAGNTEMYLSDTNETNFVLVNSFPVEGTVSLGFGISIYGSTILFAPYKQQTRLATDPLHIHMSRDGGLTWSHAHTAPATQTWHYHDVAFDPYRQRIWFTCGDYRPLANVFYSDDWGATWKTLWITGVAPTQFTTIHPMPNLVVFGTDQSGYHGAYRCFFKPDGSHVLEPIYARCAPGGNGAASYRGKQYWDAKAVYFSSVSPSVLIATKDGETFYTLWGSPIANTAISLIFGEDVNHKLIFYGTNAGVPSVMVCDAPVWSAI